MKRRLSVGIALVIAANSAALWFRAASADESLINKGENRPKIPLDELRLTVTYDNNPYRQGLKTAWGFSCFIEGADELILFDTGGEAPVLLANMDSLSIEPEDIDIVVLSHAHDDHTGGLGDLLQKNPHVRVCVPKSFSGNFKKRVKATGAEVIEVGDPVEICTNVYSVGELGSWIKEQSLVVHTDRGLVVITGCAHPGIVSIVNRAKQLLDEDVLVAMGGFHLLRASESEIKSVISDLMEAGVAYAGPCHCSGDNARDLFSEQYGDNYIEIGVGTVLTSDSFR